MHVHAVSRTLQAGKGCAMHAWNVSCGCAHETLRMYYSCYTRYTCTQTCVFVCFFIISTHTGSGGQNELCSVSHCLAKATTIIINLRKQNDQSSMCFYTSVLLFFQSFIICIQKLILALSAFVCSVWLCWSFLLCAVSTYGCCTVVFFVITTEEDLHGEVEMFAK